MLADELDLKTNSNYYITKLMLKTKAVFKKKSYGKLTGAYSVKHHSLKSSHRLRLKRVPTGAVMLGATAAGTAIWRISKNSLICKQEDFTISKNLLDAAKQFSEATQKKVKNKTFKRYNSRKITLYNGLELKLDARGKLDEAVVEKIQKEIINLLNKTDGYKEVKDFIECKDARIINISYEGGGFRVGGQRDVFQELSAAFDEQNIPNWSVSPAFNYQKYVNNSLTDFGLISKEINGEKVYFYKAADTIKGVKIPAEGYRVIHIGDFPVYEGIKNQKTKMSVFYSDELRSFFIKDEKTFNLGLLSNNENIYSNKPETGNLERARMAQFNNLTFEFLAQCAGGNIKIPFATNGIIPLVPTSIVSHEAWQSGGLLMKLRLLTYAREASTDSDRLSFKTAQILRKLANNTLVPIHNCAPGYQGMIWKAEWGASDACEPQMHDYLHRIFGKYAHDIVKKALLINEKYSIKKYHLENSKFERLGFLGSCLNPAAASLILGNCGAVSEGYKEETVNDIVAGELRKIFKIKEENGCLFALPNGVNKELYTPTESKVSKFAKSIKEKGVENREALRLWSRIKPYCTDGGMILPEGQFKKAKFQNQAIMIELLKKQFPSVSASEITDEYELPFVGLYERNCRKGVLKCDVDIEDARPDTPIFSMVARFDDQKGLRVAACGYKNLMRKWNERVSELSAKGDRKGAEILEKRRPIFLCNLYGKDENIENYILGIKQEMGKDGRRMIITETFLKDEGLDFLNMTTNGVYPSDFEPFGISELKHMYGGNHVVVTNVGGMKSIDGAIGRKEVSVTGKELNVMLQKNNFESINPNVNAIMLDEAYTPLVSMSSEDDRLSFIEKYGQQCGNAMYASAMLPERIRLMMDLNAIRTDVSWRNGSVQNYIERLGIKIPAEVQEAA